MAAIDNESYLYKNFFKGTTLVTYDTTIDSYNWNLILLVQFIAYFIINALLRKFAPGPGPIEDFEKRKKMRDYHTYYFQYTSLIHALVSVIGGNIFMISLNKAIDPIALYIGGYRYNQLNHIAPLIMNTHALAYFLYDSIIEKIYGTSDLLMDLHHICVLSVAFTVFRENHSGFELLGKIFRSIYCLIVLHLLAEVSNPSLILRTMLRISGQRNSKLYKINEVVFAVIFILARFFLTPLFAIYMFEAENVLYSVKFGVIFILYVQMFWCYRIIELTFL